MTADLVSIVLPIYNVEAYLDRCIRSVIGQTYGNLEIILVDDGSPDGCPALCDSWAARDPRIQVVHKQNAGLGMARNTGLDHATGEYIFFFDSDDYVAPDTVEKCVASARKYESQMVLYGLHRVDDGLRIVGTEIPSTPRDFYEGEEILGYILPGMLALDPVTGKKINLNMSAWGRMYSVKLIRDSGWRFVSEREQISEDYYSLLDLSRYLTRVSVVHEAFYYYCNNGASLTHTYNEARFGRLCRCHGSMRQLCEKFGYSQQIRDGVDSQFIGNVIGTMKMIAAQDRPFREKRQLLSSVVRDSYLQEILHNMSMKTENTGRRVFILMTKCRLTTAVYGLLRLKM